ncbi:hypothetical protein COL447_16120 [Helicobacter pylori]
MIRFYDVLFLVSRISKNAKNIKKTFKTVFDKILVAKHEFKSPNIFEKILKYMHF